MKSNIVDPIVSRLLASWQTNLLSVSVCLCLSVCLSLFLSLSLSLSMSLSSKVQLSAHREQRRRLVINIGGQKFGSQILGCQKFRKNIFSDNILKTFWKNLFLFWKFHRQLISKSYTLHSKFTPFSLYFSFFFLSCF